MLSKQGSMDYELVQPHQPEAATLESWLESLKFTEYLEGFRNHGFTLALIGAHGLDEHDLSAMGITKRAHVKALMHEANLLRKVQSSPLAGFASHAMASSPIDASRACFYLDLALELKDEKVARVCLDFIEKNTTEALSSPNFLNCSSKALEAILASPALQIDELSLYLLFMRWRSSHPVENVAPLLRHVRFGVIPAEILAKIVEPTKLVPPELLLAAYRRHAVPGYLVDPPSPHFFTPRVKGSSDLQPIFPNSAKGLRWALKMSSQYGGLPNSQESLVNDQPCMPGCATNCSNNEYVQASFDWPVMVSRIRLGAPKDGLFASQGWGASYLNGTEIQCSEDEEKWETVHTIVVGKPDGYTDCDLKEPKISRFWRLTKKSGYVATGCFILE